jgi:hypothetical protein
MLAQADKNRTTVIIYKDDHAEKIHTFLTDNNIHPFPRNPINKDCKLIQETLQQNNLIFNINQIKHLIQKNPMPPTLDALLKLHKPNIPIRLVVNNNNATTYKIARKLNNLLKQYLQLDNRYITTNSSNLAHNLATLKINKNHKINTYDNKDLYVNIPIEETIRITKHHLLKNNDIHITKQIITVLKIILEQNHFAFKKKYTTQIKEQLWDHPFQVLWLNYS